jgi:flagellar motility protein MotE (MotC chaperone)
MRNLTPKVTKRRFRLLPMTATMLALLLVVKLNEVYLGSEQLRALYTARDAVAEEKKEAAEEHAEAEKKPADGEAKPEGEAAKEGEKTEDAHAEGEKKEEGKSDEKKAEEEPRTYGTGRSTLKDIEALRAKENAPRYSQDELNLLQNLNKRREELDQRERDLVLKSKTLEATEKRINDKIDEMKNLQAELSRVIAQYNEKQDAQIKSLVKIYENMKPDEAAAIFNEMEMPILLEVIAKMSERKVAPVLANMSPKKARDVTQELAEKRRSQIPMP